MKIEVQIQDTIETIQTQNILINMMRPSSNAMKILIGKQQELLNILKSQQLKKDRLDKLNKLNKLK